MLLNSAHVHGAGAHKVKERTYLKKEKESGLIVDLTKLLGQKQYLRDESTLLAEENYIKEVELIEERVKAQEDAVSEALPYFLHEDTSIVGSAESAGTGNRPKSVPRVGTVRRVPRPTSGTPASAAEANAVSSLRPGSATGK